jgi:hypothetical protein
LTGFPPTYAIGDSGGVLNGSVWPRLTVGQVPKSKICERQKEIGEPSKVLEQAGRNSPDQPFPQTLNYWRTGNYSGYFATVLEKTTNAGELRLG